jgi:hypothetical protein
MNNAPVWEKIRLARDWDVDQAMDPFCTRSSIGTINLKLNQSLPDLRYHMHPLQVDPPRMALAEVSSLQHEVGFGESHRWSGTARPLNLSRE